MDVIINNAGAIGNRVPYAEVPGPDYDEVFAVNTKPPFLIVQECQLRIRDDSRIVNVSTSLGRGSRNAGQLAYSMSKAAVDTFIATLTKDLSHQDITVNAVGPGATVTDMNATRLATTGAREAIASRSPSTASPHQRTSPASSPSWPAMTHVGSRASGSPAPEGD